MDKDFELSRKYKNTISKANPGLFEKQLITDKKKLYKTLYGKELPSIFSKPTTANCYGDPDENAKALRYSSHSNLMHSKQNAPFNDSSEPNQS